MASQPTKEAIIARESTVATTVPHQESLAVQADWDNQVCLFPFFSGNYLLQENCQET